MVDLKLALVLNQLKAISHAYYLTTAMDQQLQTLVSVVLKSHPSLNLHSIPKYQLTHHISPLRHLANQE
jgi:hypothetical protein